MLASLQPVPVSRRLPPPAPDPLRNDVIRLAEDDVVQAALRLVGELTRVAFVAMFPDERYSVSAATIYAPYAMYRLRDALQRRRELLNG